MAVYQPKWGTSVLPRVWLTQIVPSERPFVIKNNEVWTGSPVHITYVRGQLLQANNEHNKAKQLPATLDEYKQVLLGRILPEKPTEYHLRESKNTQMDWRTG
jgi:hypothetical protein